MTGQSCALLLVNNKKLENFKFTSCGVFNQTFELRANSGPTFDGSKTYFMVSWTSTNIKLVHETTKYGLAPLEVGPEFALNLGFVN
jgi:hypothetical protein